MQKLKLSFKAYNDVYFEHVINKGLQDTLQNLY